jgi:hypothetical protein
VGLDWAMELMPFVFVSSFPFSFSVYLEIIFVVEEIWEAFALKAILQQSFVGFHILVL